MEKKMQQTLLDEFSVPSYEQWLQLVEKQLKGVPFEKKLVTGTSEGISIQPIYRKNDVKIKTTPIPGSFPYLRDARLTGSLQGGWQVAQEFLYPDPEVFNQAALYDLARGLTSVSLTLDLASYWGVDPDNDNKGITGKSGVSLVNRQDLQKAFQSFDFKTTTLHINPRLSYLPFLGLLIDYLDNQKIQRDTLKGNLLADPLAELAEHGGLTIPLEKAFDEMAACVSWTSKNTPLFKAIGINLRSYANAGASATQELSVALASGVEYLRQLQDRGIDIETAAGNMVFYFSMGSDFFLNIAKIRAARCLWAKVIQTCDGSAEAQKMRIFAGTSRFNKTRFDAHVNILRATTEAYSAVLAGCDSVCIAPFDDVFSLPDEMSRRISRNIQIVIKEECHGHRIIDPGGGAWFLEELTNQLAEKSWSDFQEIEKQGGICQMLLEGKIQQQIANVAAAKKEEVGRRKQVIVGTNMFSIQDEELQETNSFNIQNFQKKRSQEVFQYKSSRDLTKQITIPQFEENSATDRLVEDVLKLANKEATLGQLCQALSHGSERFTTTNSLSVERLASDYELLRQKANDYKKTCGERPLVYLINMGPLKQHKARADFSTGFLEPGGFKVIGSDGFESVKEAVETTLTVKAKIAVICSNDETYPELVPELVSQIKTAKPEMTVVLAGYPKDHIDSFKELGIEEFIHLKANNLKLLQMFQQKTGV